MSDIMHTKKLGWFLCWAVVFADIGTSIYYVPGILYGQVGNLAGLFVTLTSVAFILLVLKYIEITDRYAEGGGVVTVATRAFGPWFGALGGMFITVDYFLTASISAVSGFDYLASVANIAPYIVILSVAGLVLLGLLNVIGIKESAGVTSIIAVAACVVDVALFIFVATQIRPDGWRMMFSSFTQVGHLPPWAIVTGFSGSFLAFSGLESISQLSPAMAVPRKKVASIAMGLVIFAIIITSPTLTLFSTNVLSAKIPGGHETILQNVAKVSERQILLTKTKNVKVKQQLQSEVDMGTAYAGQFISELGAQYAGSLMKIAVVLTASILLLFASNTAIIGAYHVFMALSRQNFLPKVMQSHNQKFGTPHWAILLAIVAPIIIVIVTNGNLNILGDLYAFGLLGAFGLSSTGLDVVRWKEGQRRNFTFLLGLFTSGLVIVAWMTNLYSKQMATMFGGSVTVVGMIIAYVIYTYFPQKISVGRLALTPLPQIKKGQLLVPVFDEFDESLFAFAINQAKSLGKTITVLYIREFTDILQTISDNVNLDSEAEEFLRRVKSIFGYADMPVSILYTSGTNTGDIINTYRGKLKPSLTLLTAHRQSGIMDFLRGNVVEKVIGYPNGDVLIYTGTKAALAQNKVTKKAGNYGKVQIAPAMA
ncbi:MAG TPA: universal stress protein [Candidatus Saccharimonadales bacterium]|nr:universal stress protein [Candidatus Saccharimonadales bacterium]